MRIAVSLVVALLLLVAAFYAGIIVASESGEVVTLVTRDAEGRAHTTRLWVVDHAGSQWVRTGHPGKAWFRRVQDDPRVELQRGDVTSPRRAVPVTDPAVADAVAAAFARKYGAADWIVALSGDAAERVPVRLDPREP